MATKLIIKLRNIILLVTSIILFVGTQIVPATNSGKTFSFLEALSVSLLLFFLHFSLWSTYMYNEYKYEGFNSGKKLNYKVYQIIGLFFIIITFIVISKVYILDNI